LALIAAAFVRPLLADAADAISAALPAQPAPLWLTPDEACDFVFETADGD